MEVVGGVGGYWGIFWYGFVCVVVWLLVLLWLVCFISIVLRMW